MRHIIPNLQDFSKPLVDVPKNIYTSASKTYSKTWLVYFSNRYLLTSSGWFATNSDKKTYATFESIREINDNEKIRDEFLTILLRMGTEELI